ncbi:MULTISPECIES: hypothetical protein [unclassified Janthinobacterium]|uniref:hypothetical protein n=1 Tax=unclassified Janthinobacterium TaxID=2610881 RepID=UPI00160A1CDE|nr:MULTISPECIES: hypothetical protein [unclassified Janthinobacterium]MBB5609026.1 hypothetical protein [Janthinobacterium sp. S3T4]MBB5614243.1 hypothetical protein [Janthinobacterium sp. S3M3]
MSRNMTATNTEIFHFLDNYCIGRSNPIRNANTPRWIAGPTANEKAFLADAKIVFTLNFTLTRRAAIFEHLGRAYFCLVGFDEAEIFGQLTEVEVTGGIFTTIIGELLPKPIKSTDEIRNIVEAQDRSNSGHIYKGHSLDLMKNLFPSVSVFTMGEVSETEAYRIFFRFCAMECENGDFWIKKILSSSLTNLCDLDSLHIPYQTLCRSVFDADPAGLFLALYRCIEALYSYKSAGKIATEFNLTKDWNEISIILEATLGWRATEASSLNSLLTLCDETVFPDLFTALGITIDQTILNIKDLAGKQIYKLRNALVHFRPIHHRKEYEKIDWNLICVVMTEIVRCIYEKIFSITIEEPGSALPFRHAPSLRLPEPSH